VFSCNLRILFIRHRHAGPRAGQYDCVVLLFSGVSENTSNHYYFDMVLVPDWKAESKYFTQYPNVWVYYLGAHFFVFFFSGETKMKSMDIGGGGGQHRGGQCHSKPVHVMCSVQCYFMQLLQIFTLAL